MILNDSDIIHLLNRFGFGADADSVKHFSLTQFYDMLFPKRADEIKWPVT